MLLYIINTKQRPLAMHASHPRYIYMYIYRLKSEVMS